MIQRVFEQVSRAQAVDAVVVATDDERIARHVEAFGGRARLTRPEHPSGTDRCAEVAGELTEYDLVVNVQGDEPFIDPAQIDEVIRPLLSGAAAITTLARPIARSEELFNENVVKVVCDQKQHALYFSRSPIPYLRGAPREEWLNRMLFYKHLGIYGFRRTTLLDLTRLSPSRYEQAEALEQLRWLEAGYRITVGITEGESLGIDTPEDLERARGRLVDG